MASSSNRHFIEKLKCKVCIKFYLNPVTLPCKCIICSHHIKEQTKNINEKYKCDLCEMKHEIPKHGFPANIEIIDMLKLNLHVDDKTKLANELIDQLDKVIKDLKLMNDPENFIFDYISETKNKLDLRRERLKSKIDEIFDGMIKKVNEYDKECKQKCPKLKTKNTSDKYLDELDKLSFSSKDQLRDENLNKNIKDKIINTISNQLAHDKNNLFDLTKKLLNGKGCYFDPSNFEFEQNCFGELFIDEFSKTNNFNEFGRSKLDDKTILTPILSRELIKLCGFKFTTEFKLLYRATIDGFSAENFHLKCDNIPKTLTIIKVKDQPHIFGGYTEATWEDKLFETHKSDRNAFIFSLVNDDDKPLKFKANRNYANAIYCSYSYGPTFGYYDFRIKDYSNRNPSSCANFSSTYLHPLYQNGSYEAKTFLAGSEKFLTSEIEVYQVS